MADADASGEEALVAARRAKAERLRSRGQNPFSNDVDRAARVPICKVRECFEAALVEPRSDERYEPEKVAAISEATGELSVLGRLMARRGFGKASFFKLRDETGELQLFAKKDVLGEAFATLEDIDIADHVQARGRVMATKTGELTLELYDVRLVTKALRPLPDKWHGLVDVDLRHRRRHVDLIANPEAAAVMRARSFIVQGLRAYLDGAGFVEVETPTLHTLIGGAAAKPFLTHHNALDIDLYLRIAPELFLKRLLVGGFERVYEIGRCYRNEGMSTRHNPEFTMLEFYQAYASYETLMAMTEDMLRHVDRHLGATLRGAGLGSHYERWLSERPFSFEEPFARVPLRSALEQALDRAELPREVLERLSMIAVHGAKKPANTTVGHTARIVAAANPEADALVESYRARSSRAASIDWANLRRALGGCESDGERLFVAYEYLAEPFLADDYRSGEKSLPVFVIDHPVEVSPLARRKESDPTLTDRFELFVQGRELCNAFSELNDPDDQAARFREQVEKRERGAEETMDYDADYVRALEHGMPPAAGFGLGVDRLTMLLTGQASIREVIAFPLLRPESD